MDKWAVVTGASSGLGAKFAYELASRGYNLVIVARRDAKLKAVRRKIRGGFGVECEIVKTDLSKKENCLQFFGVIKDLNIEVFINNAGFGDCGKFVETDLEKELDMIDINVRALHILTKFVLRKFKENNHGYLLNVASSAGLLPAGPFMSTYYATKSYVTSLTRGIAAELQREGSNVYIGCLCPGPVDTEFNSVANVEFALKGISADYCADYALRKMFARVTVIVPGIKMKLATAGMRLLSQDFGIMLTGNQQKKKIVGK